MRRLFALMALGCSCNTSTHPPGDEVLGQFHFHAGPDGGSCDFKGVPLDAGFEFDAVFSRFRDGGQYWVTIGGQPHTAAFDGQRITASYMAPRNFAECTCAPDGGSVS